MKKTTITFLLLILFISLLSFVQLSHFLQKFSQNNISFNKEDIPPFYLKNSISPIYIDGNGGSYFYINWTTAAAQPWCTYDGIMYYIENLVIDGDGHEPCITIRDSTVSFIIRNCILHDADNGYYNGYGAISLYNVDNGIISDNNIYSNDINGIYLSKSDKNVIEKNTCSNNQGNGIYLSNSDDNVIKNNTCSNNDNNGIYLSNSDVNKIENNTCMFNDYDGIILNAQDGYQCNLNKIINNNIRDNYYNALKIVRCNDTIIKDNICFSNSQNGIYLDDSHATLIENNTCLLNSGSGISINSNPIYICYNTTIIYNTVLNNDFYGIHLSSSKDLNISHNIIKNNNNWGMILFYCDIFFMSNNFIWDNTIETNGYGIYMYRTEHTYIFENLIRDNIVYGIYLNYYSSYNIVIDNILANNGLYCICYKDNSINNIFNNFGCIPVNLDQNNENPEDSRFPPYLLYSVIFLIFFIGIISGISILSISKRKKMRENGIEVDNRGSIIMRDGANFFEQYELEKLKVTTPIEVKPYEFFCFSCQKKSIGHEIFCPTCGQRMKLYDPSNTLVTPLKQKEKDQNKCIICFQSACPTCNSDLIGDDNCFEECPYCESIYHRHCWNKTIHTFGKCGFCLEPPPPELIPKDF